MNKKTLVAYFSASDVTKRLAENLSTAIGADLHEIQPEVRYTRADLNWLDKKSRSTIEMNDPTSRPAIGNKVENMDQYEVVFLGFPIWWHIAPTIINTFLESYDFTGKTIVPFCTSGGDGVGRTDDVLHALCPDTVAWKPCKLLNGRPSQEALASWVNGLGL